MSVNITPRRLAFFSALVLATLISLFAYLIWDKCLTISSLKGVITIFILTFLSAYFVFYFFVSIFIYRKINVIYNKIYEYNNNSEKQLQKLKMSEDIISIVDQEVTEWTNIQSRKLADMTELENLRRNFLSNVSHELKTPIFNIQGFIHTLIDGGIHDESINMKYLTKASNNVERLQTIVEDLEIISKLESGQMVLEMTTFDIKRLVNEVFEDLELKSQQQKIRLYIKDASQKACKVRADRETIRQILINLIENSIKYGNQGGETAVSFVDIGDKYLVEITDNGIGIPENHLPHVFERFYRVDKGRSRKQGGSGLGLSIVKHIIEAHRQTISVRSEQGKGTSFVFTLEKA